MIIVLDASSAGEIAAKTHAGVHAINVLMSSDRTLAPELYISEICSIMWKLSRKDKANSDDYVIMADECINYIDEYISADSLWKEAIRLAMEQDHSVYDMLYAVLARRHDATLLTMDVKLSGICEKLAIRYKNPGSY